MTTKKQIADTLWKIIESAKSPKMGMGHVEYTIDGWELYHSIRGFIIALNMESDQDKDINEQIGEMAE
jgi:hypothetical protein